MSENSAPLVDMAPDRVFANTILGILGVALTCVLLGHGILNHAMQREARDAERALVAAGEAAATRSVIATLDQLASPVGTTAPSVTLTKLAWEIDRLITTEQKRLAYGPSGPGTYELRAELEKAVSDALAMARERRFDLYKVNRLKLEFERDILPQVDLIAVQQRAVADDSRDFGGKILMLSLLLQSAGLILFCGSVGWPAWRRIRLWVKNSKDADRINRFRLLHDNLTGMPNATYLEAYLARLIASAGRKETQTAVLRIDIDRFKVLHEALSKRASDEIIRIVARRLQNALRLADFAAYLGSDDFVVVAGELKTANDAANIAGRIQQALVKPFSVEGGPRKVSCSIGVTLLSDDEPDVERVQANADIALADAQASGVGTIRYFSESQREEVERRERLYNELATGLERGEVIAFFQPQIDLRTGAVSGCEALVRWEHPMHGLLTPAAFLDFADQSDLTERLGEVVLSRALEALRFWDKAGHHVPRVGVNFALAQLRNPRLIEKIKWETERLNLEPDRLAIEVLETVLIKSDHDMVVRNLRGLSSAGFQIEMDDFGTGHASVSNLRRFMVNRIKIDRGFIFGIETSIEQQQLTAAMIAMARALGIETLAEGIETEDAERVLRDLGCDHYQGFYKAKPMSLADTLSWLKAQGTHRAATGMHNMGDEGGSRDPNTP